MNNFCWLNKSIPVSSRAQVLEQFRHQLHFGGLHPGDRLPSVRELASYLCVNPKTSQSIYRALQEAGLAEIRPRSGVFVARSEVTREQERVLGLAAKIRKLVREARALGIPDHQVKSLLERYLNPGENAHRCAMVECNRELLALSCRDLARKLKIEVVPLLLDDLRRKDPPVPATVSVLLTTEYHLEETRRIAQSLHKPVYGICLRRDFLSHLEEQLNRGKALFVVKAPSSLTFSYPA